MLTSVQRSQPACAEYCGTAGQSPAPGVHVACPLWRPRLPFDRTDAGIHVLRRPDPLAVTKLDLVRHPAIGRPARLAVELLDNHASLPLARPRAALDKRPHSEAERLHLAVTRGDAVVVDGPDGAVQLDLGIGRKAAVQRGLVGRGVGRRVSTYCVIVRSALLGFE